MPEGGAVPIEELNVSAHTHGRRPPGAWRPYPPAVTDPFGSLSISTHTATLRVNRTDEYRERVERERREAVWKAWQRGAPAH